MRKELAQKVYDHLRKFPSHHFPPPKKDGSELLFFEKPFVVTDEEGELMLLFNPYGEHLEVLASRAGLDKGKTLELLDSLTRKCWILRQGSREEGKYWLNFSPVEFWMPYFTSKERYEELISLYIPDPPEPGITPPPYRPVGTGEDEDLHQLRVIPIERALSYNTEILPSEVVSYMIETAGDELAVAECLCRKTKQVTGGEPCQRGGLIEQCLFLPPFAAAAVDAGVARKITKKEAYELMEKAREHGLFHQAYSAAHSRIICSCCPCCCQAFNMRQAGMLDATTPSNFYSQIDPGLCQGSLECIQKCPAKAIRFDKEKKTAIVDAEKCYGCGMCVESCPTHAVSLKRREKVIIFPETEDDMGEIRTRQGKGSRELFSDYAKGR